MKSAWLVVFAGLMAACSNENVDTSKTEAKAGTLQGEAQGTTYSIKYYGADVAKSDIDSVLKAIDNSLSSWEEGSLINQLNYADSTSVVFDDYNGFFTDNFSLSRQVWKATNGAFDPSVAPLTDAWGFGFSKAEDMNEAKVDSILEFVGFDYGTIRLSKPDDRFEGETQRILVKEDLRTRLDFNAIAQGYSVDVLADFIESKGISSYLIELGGEMKVGAAKPNGDNWVVGIDKPEENPTKRTLQAKLGGSDFSIATSGNYRKFYVKDGIKYAHTINPKTGFPVNHSLLSATVVHANCGLADAYATAFMVMGLQETMKFLEREPGDMDVLLIYSDENGAMQTYSTKGIETMMIE